MVERLFRSAIGMTELLTVYLGERLGLYRALAGNTALTPAELAARTGTHERYAREWLEQQAAAGILDVEDPSAEPGARRYRLPAAHAEVLLDGDSLYYLAPMARLLAGVARPLPALLEAFRSGHGVPYHEYGPDTREGIAELNRPMFMHLLGTRWLPAMPDVHARLQADPPARIADLGCGTGWSSIAMARTYPTARVDGYDLDGPSIGLARRNAESEGLADRVTFHVRDASDPALAGQYDLVTAFECVHDMGRPVEALQTMRRLAGEGGTVFIADERVAETFTAPGDDLEQLNYGFSVLHCLPAGLADTPSAGTGTVMRPDTLRRYAAQAGFRDVQVVPIQHDLWRFYRLVP
jgi:2-polyprenyl-3-methyl-5-hydroxy-6-metoxy-1,4-benzoquinol methylase